MSLNAKRILIAILGAVFLISLLFVQWTEVVRRQQEAGLLPPHIEAPESSRACVECHEEETPGIAAHWSGSTHAEKGVGCLDCHRDPAPHLRPSDRVTDLDWDLTQDDRIEEKSARELGQRLMKEREISPSTDCSTCHR